MDTLFVDTLTYDTTTPTSPPTTPLAGFKSTTPRDMPTMYHLDLYTTNRSEPQKLNLNTIASTEEPDIGASTQLVPCSICQRTFNPITLQKHTNICEKMAAKKRKVFDSQRQRREGTELASYLPKNFGLPTPKGGGDAASESRKPPESPAVARKKMQEEGMRSTARSNVRKTAAQQEDDGGRGAASSGGGAGFATAVPTNKKTDGRKRSIERPTTKRSLQPASEQCPHCERCFGVKAFDRHVEWCKEKSLQSAMKQGTNDKQKAKARLEARTKYRAPNLKTKRSLNREKYSGVGEDDAEDSPKISSAKSDIMSLSMTSSVASDSGLPTDYDPFLFAKRQLEDLCSPLAESMPQTLDTTTNTTPKTSVPTTTALTSLSITNTTTPAPNNNKMSTSLTLNSSIPNTPFTITSAQQQQKISHFKQSHEVASTQTPTATTTPTSTSNTKTSNFRRTSSLRAPRRSPMLAARPFFAQPQRPTIQRGLSDEGPISTNFLKPEEYDEMPVRSVCQNDFAITNSPRVIRRDTSASNRKHNLKLNLNTPMTNEARTTMHDSSEERLLPNTASKYYSKTDSLAAFLKYEQDLEKLNAPQTSTKQMTNDANHQKKAIKPATPSTPTTQLDSPLISKELKDKSNNLSKQNSAKNINTEVNDVVKNDSVKTTTQLLPLNKAQVKPSLSSDLYNINNNKSQIRLEPITKPNTPLTKPSTPLPKPQTPLYYNTKLPAVKHTAINLSALNCEPKSAISSSVSFNKERQISEGSDYIDPKLINKCDNLPVNLASLQGRIHNDSTSSRQCNGSSTSASASTSSSECTPAQANKTPSTQLTKLLPLTRFDQSNESTQLAAASATPVSLTQFQHIGSSCNNSTTHSSTTSQRNSADGRNLLKRKMRLGRNQFLYDASPEADSCSADDEGNNRSSIEYDDHNDHNRSQQIKSKDPTAIESMESALPIFDEFDFEEFLAKFENPDDEQFPLFKDCREFLMNRTLNNRQYSFNTHAKHHHNTKSTNTQATTPLYSPSVHALASHRFNSETHFPFTNIKTNPKPCPLTFTSTPLTTSFRRNVDRSPNSVDYDDMYNTSPQYNESDPEQNNEQKKREIFISIETTEHNDLGSSPNSLRNMIGNTTAVIEFVDADGNDNKFSKITDDDVNQQQQQQQQQQQKQSPNVQLNNAKNLIQKMQEDFRQLGEEVGADLRQAVYNEAFRSQVNNNNNSNNTNNNTAGNSPAGIPGESDDMTSLDNFSIDIHTSRQLGSKLSADSAYGSLSRQRSSELSVSRNRTRPSTSNAIHNAQQQQQQQQNYHHYQSMQQRGEHTNAPSTSTSENSLPPISGHHFNSNNYQQQQFYNNNNDALPNRSTNNSSTSLHGLMTSSMKMSKFCHECGSKFIIEQAKFCMDCGVKRLMM